MAISLPGFWEREFWYDEAFTGILVRSDWTEFWQIIRGDVHPPLYYLLVKIWGIIFGYNDLALRGFSTFCFGIFLFLNASFWRQREGNWFAFGTTLFFALNPFFLQHAQEARMYMFLLLCTYSSGLLFWKILEKNSKYFTKEHFFLGVFLGILALTHYLSFLFALSMGVFFFLFWKKKKPYPFLSLLLLGGKISLTAFLVLSPWLPYALTQIRRTGGLHWIPEFPLSESGSLFGTFLFGSQQGQTGVPSLNTFSLPLSSEFLGFLFFLCIIFLMGMFLGIRKKNMTTEKGPLLEVKGKIFLLLGLFFLPFLLFLSLQFFDSHYIIGRYLFFLLPFLFLGFFFLLREIIDIHENNRYLQRTIPMLTSLYILLLLFLNPTFTPTYFQQALQQEEVPKYSQIIFSEPFSYTLGRFYAPEKEVFLYNVDNPKENFSGWQIIKNDAVFHSLSEIPSGTLIISSQKDSPFPSFAEEYGFYYSAAP